jgi:hypothetical protein
MPALAHKIVVGAVLTTALLGVACSDDDGGGSDPSDQVTALIERVVPSAEVSASCPDDASGTFDCDVTVGSQQITVPVEDVDGTVELKDAVVNVGDTERKIETKYNQQEGVAVSAECGDNPDDAVLVGKVGSTFGCEIVQSGGAPSTLTVTIDNLDGKVSYSL